MYVLYVLTIALANLALGYGTALCLRRNVLSPEAPTLEPVAPLASTTPVNATVSVEPVTPAARSIFSDEIASKGTTAPAIAEDAPPSLRERATGVGAPTGDHYDSPDTHTNLIDRTGFEDLLARWRHEDPNQGRVAALGLMEIDQLAEIRSQHGAAVAERLASEVAPLIDDLMRKPRGYDVAAYYDERRFCFFFGDTSPRDATHALERIRLAIAESRFELCAERLTVTASCGVASLLVNVENDLLFARLELATRQASILGGNRTTLDEGLGPSPIEPLAIEVPGRTLVLDA